MFPNGVGTCFFMLLRDSLQAKTAAPGIAGKLGLL